MLKHDIRPSYPVVGDHLTPAYETLANLIRKQPGLWLADGASGVDWKLFIDGLKNALQGQAVEFLDASRAHIGAEAAKKLLQPYLDTGDPDFGKLYDGSLADFFAPAQLKALADEAQAGLKSGKTVLVYGTGAGLLALPANNVFVDLPSEAVRKLASAKKVESIVKYEPPSDKILSNVDFPVINGQRGKLLPALAYYVDFRNPQAPVGISGAALRGSLHALAQQPFRVTPVIYSSMWGGQHLIKNIEAMRAYPRCSHYYAMFPPVNTLVLRDGNLELEMPFENMLYLETAALQGSLLEKAFGVRMPIRATIMDTLEGMTLSHQIHPNHAQAKRIFNTDFDEPETYYFLETTPESSFYLGLRDDADHAAFRRAVQRAVDEQIGFDLSDYVNLYPAHKNDVVHVPASMVHNAGPQSLILEVTTHPIGHTYRLYDFMRRTSDGKLRPLHVEQSFSCLDVARNRTWAEQQGLFPKPKVLLQGDGWHVSRRVAPPITKFTEDEISFTKDYPDDTRGERFHLLLGLEGDDLRVEGNGFNHPLHQFELLIVPAAAGAYRLVNEGGSPARVLKLYVSTPEEYQAAEI